MSKSVVRPRAKIRRSPSQLERVVKFNGTKEQNRAIAVFYVARLSYLYIGDDKYVITEKHRNLLKKEGVQYTVLSRRR